MLFPPALNRLVEAFRRLPGIGPKTALRLAFFVLSMDNEEVEEMSRALIEAKRRVKHCSRCRNLAEQELCAICRDSRRDSSLLCVVQEPQDIMVIEKQRNLKAGILSCTGPFSGGGHRAEELKIPLLLELLKEGEVRRSLSPPIPTWKVADGYYIARRQTPGCQDNAYRLRLPVMI